MTARPEGTQRNFALHYVASPSCVSFFLSFSFFFCFIVLNMLGLIRSDLVALLFLLFNAKPSPSS